jgi:hypothetical protein
MTSTLPELKKRKRAPTANPQPPHDLKNWYQHGALFIKPSHHTISFAQFHDEIESLLPETPGPISYAYVNLTDVRQPNYKFSPKDLPCQPVPNTNYPLLWNITMAATEATGIKYDVALINYIAADERGGKVAQLGERCDNEFIFNPDLYITSISFMSNPNRKRRLAFLDKPGSQAEETRQAIMLGHGDTTCGPDSTHYHGLKPKHKIDTKSEQIVITFRVTRQ